MMQALFMLNLLTMPWRLAIGLVLCCLATACGGREDHTGNVPTGQAPLGPNASIAFEHDGALQLLPTEQLGLTLTASPAGRYSLSFHLVGDALDASIDRSQTTTNETGQATLMLRAPSMATTFRLRASIADGPSTELPVAVSKDGFGNIRVNPIYGGTRPVEQWTVNVLSGTKCEAIASTWPDDLEGAFIATAKASEPLLIEGLPVGPSLTVAVRSEKMMWGCKDETMLQADELMDVNVNVVDKPAELGEATLSTVFEFAPEPSTYEALLDQHLNAMTARFGVSAQQTAPILLSAMEKANPAILAQALETQMAQHLEGQNSNVTGTLTALAAAGKGHLTSEVVTHIVITDVDNGMAEMTIQSVQGVDAATMATETQKALNVTIDPDDTVRVGGTFEWLPSRLLAGLIEKQTLTDYPNQAGIEDVLANDVGCSEMTFASDASCDISCVQAACRLALGKLWEQARNESLESLAPVAVPFEAAGMATLDPNATLTGFNGMWLGKLSSTPHNTEVKGQVSATVATSMKP